MKTTLVLIMIIFISTLAGAWDWHFRELRRLHDGEDTCLNLTECHTIEKRRYAKAQCYSYFVHFTYVPPAMHDRCPFARNARCRLHEGAWRCTVDLSDNTNSTEVPEEIAPLSFCIEHYRDWDQLVERGA
nr:PREDICTED: uncharacterized protein LOC109035129 [Bemisia tabaci]XP_018904175.1 PREDICTED: uncharacterized protein LOC109035129 [Bemisia tabaci]